MTGVRLVLHAPTEAALARARSNARNLLREAPDAEVEIVANAAGALAAARADETGPPLVLCANSLAAAGIAAPEGARVVPAAVGHIVRRQTEGWAYIRA